VASKYNIAVIIAAVDKASSTLNRVGAKSKWLADGIGSAGKGIAKAGAYAFATAGVVGAAAVKMGSDWLDAMGEIKDFSAQVGFSAEELQSWRYAADQAGVKGDALNGAVAKMNKSLGDMKAKTGPLFAILKETNNVDLFRRLQSASPEQALQMLVAEMERIQDPTERARFAMAAFGKSGAVMTRLAVEGSAGLSRLRQEAVSLGIVMSTAAVNGAEAFGDNLARLKMIGMGLGGTIMTALLPRLEKTVALATAWVVKNKDLIASKVVKFVEDLGDRFARVGEFLDTALRIIDAIGGLGGAVKLLAITYISGHLASSLIATTALAGTLSGVLAAAFGTVALGLFLNGVWDLVSALIDVAKYTDYLAEQSGAKKAVESDPRFAATRERQMQGLPVTERDSAFFEAATSGANDAMNALFADQRMSMPNGTVTVSVLLPNAPLGTSVTQEVAGAGVKFAPTGWRRGGY
jgi:hypothetical protein